MKPIVVLGSGLAGYSVIRELRKRDRDIPVALVTRDSGDYYSKPMLSNALAQGKDAAGLVLTRAAEMAKQLGIKLLVETEVHAIDRASKSLDTTSGAIAYDRLVIALGADPIRIPVQGDAADTVLSVNDIADYARFRDLLGSKASIAIMGGGLIGCEFANDLAAAGHAVSVIDPGPWPIASLMPEQAGRQLLAPLAALGVDWRFGTSVSRVDRAASGYQLTLADGAQLQAGLVLSAVGLRPRITLAQQAGLAVNRGIVVDAHLRSSDAAIFALGDCAEIDGKVQPFVLPIMHAARALAKTLAGEETPVVFPAMPVVVKTPAHPVAVLSVARDAVGSWQLRANSDGVKMEFLDAEQRISGFVLTGPYAAERNEMSKQVGQRALPV
ncbi:MAG: FAD-dependent oxidoreductase [Gammaproteobacteria bacterium]|nr:FAD-dependent oxidoreductase [Gammaproteobacteria bacterium]MBU1777458.1 FAD-dependent oxidoreductase [Gammaproteobacteria bacterium]MBU1968009.1 FAD-dependent oxidoreductase [Gammaproteobacteria bacterium]